MSKVFTDTAVFFGGHALILGHKPGSLSLDQINNKLEKDPPQLDQFGLFDRSTPNYATYYPEVKAEDLTPSEDEFIEPVFRMLSSITVNASSNPIFFPVKVLKASMGKMVGQTINIDHEMAIGNAIGAVKAVEWQNAYTANGVKIPPGFNATMLIDGKSNPRIARGIMMNPPSIHANSVTVTFNWEKSHSKMGDDEFYNKLGTFDDKGKLVQRIASEIISYHETSLVSHGADPFAQLIKGGKIVKPNYAASRYPLSAQDIEAQKMNHFKWDWKQFTESYKGEELNKTDNEKNPEKMEELLRFLEVQFGLDKESLTEENYEATLSDLGIKEFTTLKTNSLSDPDPVTILDLTGTDVIEAEITRLRAEVKDIPEDFKSKLALVDNANTIINTIRENTTRLYKLSAEEGKEDASILSLIAGADYELLVSLEKQYDNLTEDKFGFTCTECGSTSVTRASANSGDQTPNHQEISNEDLISAATAVTSVDTSFIEGKK